MIVTMQQIDDARQMAYDALKMLRAGENGRHIDQHLTLSMKDRQTLYQERVGTVDGFIRQYHEHRSTPNLLRLLAHSAHPCPGFFDTLVGSEYVEQECEDCHDIAVLVEEVPRG